MVCIVLILGKVIFEAEMGGRMIDAVHLLSLQDVGYSCFDWMNLRSADSRIVQCAC